MINLDSTIFDSDVIKLSEEKYNAKYVMETCIRTKTNQWSESPVAIFYTEKAYPGGSNYFGLLWLNSHLFITNGFSATEPFRGVKLQSGDIYFSRVRHDYRNLPGGGFIDGGRDYMRAGGLVGVTDVTLGVYRGEVIEIDEFLNPDGKSIRPNSESSAKMIEKYSVTYTQDPLKFMDRLDRMVFWKRQQK